MADIEQTVPFVGHRIPVSIGTDPMPDQIIFRELVPDVRAGWINLVYKEDQEPQQGEIGAFLQSLHSQVYSASIATTVETPMDPSSPLDVNCKNDCFLVFKLADGWNWQFADSGDCFTTKKPPGGKYSDLVHVLPDGTHIGAGVPIGDGCRLLYVRARGTQSTYNDGFNLTIELLVGQDGSGLKRRTKIVIDPDIRNPGGSGGG